jgi:tRNA threonylcarbamoyladenosine biosynthesis protein TsaE
MAADETSIRILLPGPDDTEALARALAPVVGAGDTLLIGGPLGAGKSHLARTLIQTRLAARGLWEEVPSPTYTLVQEYTDGMMRILHADLFRLSGAEDIPETGLADAFGSALVLIEWPDRLGALAPAEALRISLSETDGGRSRVAVLTGGRTWRDRLAGIAADAPGAPA